VLTPRRLASRHRHPGGRRSKVDALEELPGAGLEESEASALARLAGEERGAVAGAAGHPDLLPPPRRGLRGALTGQRASHAVCGNADDIFSVEEESATRCTDVDHQPNACPADRGLPIQSQSRCSQQSRDSTGPFAPLLFLPRSPLPCRTHCSTPR
jgi:hypothetical protein